jgi:hypothetical protein
MAKALIEPLGHLQLSRQYFRVRLVDGGDASPAT